MPEPAPPPPALDAAIDDHSPDHVEALAAEIADRGRPSTPTAEVTMAPAGMTPDPDEDPVGRSAALDEVSRSCHAEATRRGIARDPTIVRRMLAELRFVGATRDPASDPRRLLRKLRSGHRSLNPANSLIVELLGLGVPGSCDLSEPPTFLSHDRSICRADPAAAAPEAAIEPPRPEPPKETKPMPETTPAPPSIAEFAAIRRQLAEERAGLIREAQRHARHLAAAIGEEAEYPELAGRFGGVAYGAARADGGWSLAMVGPTGRKLSRDWGYDEARAYAAHWPGLIAAMAEIDRGRLAEVRSLRSGFGGDATADDAGDVTMATDGDLADAMRRSSDDLEAMARAS